ncbi:MAG: hypothetical protein MI919_40040 [Holophagales bacterium]|nr:hypothetical protein [Holophagales bacterium]
MGRRSLAVALALLWSIVGVVPGLHFHDSDLAVEAHCHDSGLTASAHLETREPALHVACGLCAKVLSFDGLERPRAILVGERVSERAGDISSTKPPVFSGRHGAARAPPLA